VGESISRGRVPRVLDATLSSPAAGGGNKNLQRADREGVPRRKPVPTRSAQVSETRVAISGKQTFPRGEVFKGGSPRAFWGEKCSKKVGGCRPRGSRRKQTKTWIKKSQKGRFLNECGDFSELYREGKKGAGMSRFTENRRSQSWKTGQRVGKRFGRLAQNARGAHGQPRKEDYPDIQTGKKKLSRIRKRRRLGGTKR